MTHPDDQGGAAGGRFFLPVARFLGHAYLRNAFTKGTDQEVAYLIDAFGLRPGQRVLDAGCGPGRHALELARRGVEVVGVDLSRDFVALARDVASAERLPARFEVGDVRELTYELEFDAVICLCQGGFGLLGGVEDLAVPARLAAALCPGGRLALNAFHSYFAVAFREEGEAFEPATGVVHEVATVRGPAGEEREFELWTTCFTARELELLVERAGLRVDALTDGSPGRFGAGPPTLESPGLLVLATRVEP